MGKKSKTNPIVNMAKNPTLENPVDPSKPRARTKKPSNNKSPGVRRSGRLHSQISPPQDQEVERVIEEINLVESEREEDVAHVEDHVEHAHGDLPRNEPTANADETLTERVNELSRAIEKLKSKGRTGCVPSEGAPANENYKNLYFGSQKKIEDLKNENHELSRKLEIALGKLQVYESMDKSTESVMISNLAKATEAVVSLTSRVVGQMSAPQAKPLAAATATAAAVAVSMQKTSAGKRRRR